MTYGTEATVVEDLSELLEKVYDYMTTISGVTGLVFKGFDSSKQTLELPQIGMKIMLLDLQVDNLRPGPSEANRILIESGTPVEYTVDGETETVYPEYAVQYPLPILLTFGINTWCHNAVTQLQIDQAVLQKFPHQGVLTLTFGEDDDAVDYDFPIRTLGITPLDDLKENYRERIYKYELEAYIAGHVADETRKIITSGHFEIYLNSTDDDEDTTGGPADEVIIEPDS